MLAKLWYAFRYGRAAYRGKKIGEGLADAEHVVSVVRDTLKDPESALRRAQKVGRAS